MSRARSSSPVLVAYLLALLLGCAAEQPDLYADHQPLGTARVVAFDASRGIPVIEVDINGQGPFRLVFDTGAAMVALDQAVADQLALPAARYDDPGFLRSVGGHSDVHYRRIETLRVGTLQITGVDAAVGPFAQELSADEPVHGLFGLGAFHGWVTSVDFESETIRFADGPALAADATGVIPLADQYGMSLYVGADYEGRPVTVRVDTGASLGLFAEPRFLERHQVGSNFIPYGALRTPTGLGAVSVGRLSGDLRVGDIRFATPIVGLIQRHAVFVTVGRDWAALLQPELTLGVELLRHFRLVIDQRSRRLQFVRRSGSGPIASPPIRTVDLPLPFRREPTHLAVLEPTPGPVAPPVGAPPEAGATLLAPGDRIVAIGGTPVAKLRNDSFQGLAEGQPIAISVERGGVVFESRAPVVTLVP